MLTFRSRCWALIPPWSQLLNSLLLTPLTLPNLPLRQLPLLFACLLWRFSRAISLRHCSTNSATMPVCLLAVLLPSILLFEQFQWLTVLLHHHHLGCWKFPRYKAHTVPAWSRSFSSCCLNERVPLPPFCLLWRLPNPWVCLWRCWSCNVARSQSSSRTSSRYCTDHGSGHFTHRSRRFRVISHASPTSMRLSSESCTAFCTWWSILWARCTFPFRLIFTWLAPFSSALASWRSSSRRTTFSDTLRRTSPSGS